jgi:hypothetical protein
MQATLPALSQPQAATSTATVPRSLKLAPAVRLAVILTAAVDFLIGLAWLCGPDAGLSLWPSSVPSVLSRFIGAIVLANGVGAVMIAARGTWDGARALFIVALVYGGAVLLGLVYELLFHGAPVIFWAYVVVDFLFLFPILLILGYYEWAARPAARPA